MSRSITVGLDGSPESRAAAEWAAREARSRGLALRLVHVWEPVPVPLAQAPLPVVEPRPDPAGGVPGEMAEGLRLRHPGLEVAVEQPEGDPGEVLTAAAGESALTVLGSRGLSGVAGFLVGSVGLAVAAHAERPVVLVRAGEQAADEHETDATGIPSAATAYRPVVLGVDVTAPDDTLFAFAFEEAARRGTAVRAVHAYALPPYYVYGLAYDPSIGDRFAKQEQAALAESLLSWRRTYPGVEECGAGSAGERLIDAAREASLVVVGRRRRPAPFGARIGPVAHAVLHHATAPVAVVPHD